MAEGLTDKQLKVALAYWDISKFTTAEIAQKLRVEEHQVDRALSEHRERERERREAEARRIEQVDEACRQVREKEANRPMRG